MDPDISAVQFKMLHDRLLVSGDPSLVHDHFLKIVSSYLSINIQKGLTYLHGTIHVRHERQEIFLRKGQLNLST